jgi:membrane-associated phospholipid phosphatase
MSVQEILNWGIDVIALLQHFKAEFFVLFMKGITLLGNETAYLIMMPVVLWCVDFRTGARTGAVFLSSAYLNFIFKDILAQPRPFILEPSAKLIEASGYGIPSGHAQGSLVFFGMLALLIRKRWFTVISVILILLIAFSRIYLGVHFPTDILGGWFLGGCLLFGYLKLGNRFEQIAAQWSLWQQIVLLVATTGIMLVYITHETIVIVAAYFGLGIGTILSIRFNYTQKPSSFSQYIVRPLTGLIMGAAIYIGLACIFPKNGEPLYEPLRFVRYFILVLWLTTGAFWLFRRFEKTEKLDK